MKVWEHLQQLKNRGAHDLYCGICFNVTELMEFDYHANKDWTQFYEECVRSWEEFSGYPDYPVSGYDNLEAWSAYNRADASMMWNPEHPYGAARLRLLDHCINWFQARNI